MHECTTPTNSSSSSSATATWRHRQDVRETYIAVLPVPRRQDLPPARVLRSPDLAAGTRAVMRAPRDLDGVPVARPSVLADIATRRDRLGAVPAYVPRPVGVAFQQQLAPAGLVGLAVPEQYGGAGLGREHVEDLQRGGRRLLAAVDPVRRDDRHVCSRPARVRHRGPEAAAHSCDAARRGIWCQMFSEPGAGSDLASLQMRAVRDGTTTGCSTVRRCGRPRPITPMSRCAQRGPTRTWRAMVASRCSSCRSNARRRGPTAPADDRTVGIQRGVLHRACGYQLDHLIGRSTTDGAACHGHVDERAHGTRSEQFSAGVGSGPEATAAPSPSAAPDDPSCAIGSPGSR